jgi:hypothetical protein
MAIPLQVPALDEAQRMMSEAGARNPGPWVSHSIYVAEAAQAIARQHRGLDPAGAYILGYLHDVGRREGFTDMRHIIDGHRFLAPQGYHDSARVCLTHSFPVQEVQAVAGKWDCTPEELAWVRRTLERVEYDDYDRLIQLCDALALSSGYCLIEKRLVDVALRHGVNAHTTARWRAYLGLQQSFEGAIGQSIYCLLPGVVENTFSTNLLSL